MSQRPKLTQPAGRQAELFRDLPSGRVQCTACARRCQIGEGQIGFCGVRGVVGGKLYLLVYGKVMAGHIDPIEKKPVVHYRPGSKIFSIATSGCSWACSYCFAPETPILTDRGIAPIEEIYNSSDADGEVGFPESVRVLSHTGQWRIVDKVFRHSYKGKLLRIRPYYLPELRCTPNHGVYVADQKSGKLVKKRADQLHVGDFLAVPSPSPSMLTTSIDTAMELRLAIRGEKGLRAPATELLSDSSTVRFRRSKKSGIPRSIPLTEEFGELLGLYGAEGSSIRSSSRPNSWSVTFSFGAHEVELIERTEQLIMRIFGLRTMRVTQGPVIRVCVGSSELGLLFSHLMGTDCCNKRVPDVVLFNRSEAFRLGFIQGYLKGDGFSTQSRGTSWIGSTSVSRVLSLGVWYLMFQLGFAPRFYTSRNAPTYEIQGRNVNRHNDYMTRLLLGSDGLPALASASKMLKKEGMCLVPVRAIGSEEYEGHVYNMEVEGDHSYTSSFIAVSNCQNSDISQLRKIEGIDASPEEIVGKAVETGCDGVAYTYNQPTIFMEYARDVGRIARSKGLFNIFVSNGYDTPDTVAMMDDFLDCATVDFKGSGETSFVRKYIGIPNAEPIFESLLEMKRRGKVHIEITDLIVPRVGDSLEAADKLSRWAFDNLGPDVPVHFLRFHPDYKMMDFPWTPVETLEKHVAIGKKAGLNYVYIGNVPGHPAESTYCPGCGKVLIKRYGYEIDAYNLDEQNRCNSCGYKTPIVGPLSKSYAEDRFVSVIN